jgi:hypothetical protein
MGGKALKIETERKTTDEFNEIASEIIPIIKKELKTETFIAKCYHNKETHGDMDILVKFGSEQQNINLIDFIKENFSPLDIYNNNGVVSFDYDNFQIDIIPIKQSNWEIAKVWYSYDPFSNLCGKSSHRFGTKYGHGGLVYPFRNFNGRLSHDITLSKDPKRIFEFLGYDYERFQKGFDTLEEIFEYVISGKYFDHSIFLMENLNHIDRKRNKKRKSYQEFLQYIKNKGIKDTYDFNKDKSTYIDLIHQSFPEVDLKGKIEQLTKKDKENQELNSKFNGRMIMDIFPELTGKELGNMITNFHKSFDDYREFGLKHSSDEIMFEFGKFYQKEKGS